MEAAEAAYKLIDDTYSSTAAQLLQRLDIIWGGLLTHCNDQTWFSTIESDVIDITDRLDYYARKEEPLSRRLLELGENVKKLVDKEQQLKDANEEKTTALETLERGANDEALKLNEAKTELGCIDKKIEKANQDLQHLDRSAQQTVATLTQESTQLAQLKTALDIREETLDGKICAHVKATTEHVNNVTALNFTKAEVANRERVLESCRLRSLDVRNSLYLLAGVPCNEDPERPISDILIDLEAIVTNMATRCKAITEESDKVKTKLIGHENKAAQQDIRITNLERDCAAWKARAVDRDNCIKQVQNAETNAIASKQQIAKLKKDLERERAGNATLNTRINNLERDCAALEALTVDRDNCVEQLQIAAISIAGSKEQMANLKKDLERERAGNATLNKRINGLGKNAVNEEADIKRQHEVEISRLHEREDCQRAILDNTMNRVKQLQSTIALLETRLSKDASAHIADDQKLTKIAKELTVRLSKLQANITANIEAANSSIDGLNRYIEALHAVASRSLEEDSLRVKTQTDLAAYKTRDFQLVLNKQIDALEKRQSSYLQQISALDASIHVLNPALASANESLKHAMATIETLKHERDATTSATDKMVLELEMARNAIDMRDKKIEKLDQAAVATQAAHASLKQRYSNECHGLLDDSQPNDMTPEEVKLQTQIRDLRSQSADIYEWKAKWQTSEELLVKVRSDCVSMQVRLAESERRASILEAVNAEQYQQLQRANDVDLDDTFHNMDTSISESTPNLASRPFQSPSSLNSNAVRRHPGRATYVADTPDPDHLPQCPNDRAGSNLHIVCRVNDNDSNDVDTTASKKQKLTATTSKTVRTGVPAYMATKMAAAPPIPTFVPSLYSGHLNLPIKVKMEDAVQSDFTIPFLPQEIMRRFKLVVHKCQVRWKMRPGEPVPEEWRKWKRPYLKTYSCLMSQTWCFTKDPYGDGSEYACNECIKRKLLCVVVLERGIMTLLPMHQAVQDPSLGPSDIAYWGEK